MPHVEHGLQVLQFKGVSADEIHAVVELCQRAFEDRPASAGVVQEARHALGVVLDDQLGRVAVRDLDAVGGDGVDDLREQQL